MTPQRDWARQQVDQHLVDLGEEGQYVAYAEVVKLLRAERRRTLRIARQLEHEFIYSKHILREFRRRLQGTGGNG